MANNDDNVEPGCIVSFRIKYDLRFHERVGVIICVNDDRAYVMWNTTTTGLVEFAWHRRTSFRVLYRPTST